MAGIVVTLAHLPGRAYTEFLCIFTAIGLIPFATTRARYLEEHSASITMPCMYRSSLVHLNSSYSVTATQDLSLSA